MGHGKTMASPVNVITRWYIFATWIIPVNGLDFPGGIWKKLARQDGVDHDFPATHRETAGD